MQSDQIKSSTGTYKLDSITAISGNQTLKNNLQYNAIQNDTTATDSLSLNYFTPDSNTVFAADPGLSQFKTVYIPKFDYQKNLIKPVPYDSLQTVLKGVEVVFPGKKLIRNNPDWLVGVLVLMFILFGTVRLIFNKYLGQLLQATTNYSTFTRLFREKYFNFFHASFRLDIIFNLILGLFTYQFVSAYKINFGMKQSVSVYLVCVGLVIGYFFAKRILYQIIGILTESRQDTQEYLFNIKIYNRVLGIFLLPVTAIIAFVPMTDPELLLFGGLFVISVFYFLSLARGIKIFLKKHFSVFYLILYLCTLEFLPLLLIFSVLLSR